MDIKIQFLYSVLQYIIPSTRNVLNKRCCVHKYISKWKIIENILSYAANLTDFFFFLCYRKKLIFNFLFAVENICINVRKKE